MHWRKHPGASADVYTHSCTEHEIVYPNRPHKHMRNWGICSWQVYEERLGQDGFPPVPCIVLYTSTSWSWYIISVTYLMYSCLYSLCLAPTLTIMTTFLLSSGVLANETSTSMKPAFCTGWINNRSIDLHDHICNWRTCNATCTPLTCQFKSYWSEPEQSEFSSHCLFVYKPILASILWQNRFVTCASHKWSSQLIT